MWYNLIMKTKQCKCGKIYELRFRGLNEEGEQFKSPQITNYWMCDECYGKLPPPVYYLNKLPETLIYTIINGEVLTIR